MQHILSQEQKFSIGQELTGLGFTNVEQIIGSTSYMANSNPVTLLLADFSSPVNIEYYLEFKRNDLDQWKLDNIEAALQIESQIHPGNTDVFSKKYETKGRRIPHKSTIDKEMRNALESAKNFEKALLDKGVRSDLNSMGFTDFDKISNTPDTFPSLPILQAQQTLDTSFGIFKRTANFEFHVVCSLDPDVPYIYYVRAFLSLNETNHKNAKPEQRQDFYRTNGAFPTKGEMISVLRTGITVQGDLLHRVRTLFKIGSEKGTELRVNVKLLKPRVRVHKI